MEDFVLDRLAAVLSQSLSGQKIRSARYGEDDELLLVFEKDTVVVVLNRQHPRTYLLSTRIRDDTPPDPFVESLSTTLAGQGLISLHKDSKDRILRLEFSHKTTLVLEMIPVIANIYVLGPTGGILAQKFRDTLPSRRLAPGAAYQPPASSGKASLTACLDQIAQEPSMEIDSPATLVKRVHGFGPILAAELWTRTGGEIPRMRKELGRLRQEIETSVEWYAYFPAGFDRKDFRGFNFWRDCLISPIRLRSRGADREARFADFRSLCDELRPLESRWKKYQRVRHEHLRSLEQAVRKKHQLRENLRRQLDESSEADAFRRYGELLKMHSHIYKAQHLPEKVAVKDLFDPAQPNMEIPLPCRDSFHDNIDHYFRKAKRLERSRAPLQERLKKAETEVRAAEHELSRFNQARTAEELELIPKKPSSRKAKAGAKAAPFRRYTSSDGLTILVGKSNRENEQLTFSEARSRDLWLHAADYPGSHVVIKLENRGEIPPRSLREAAQLAAFYSKAKDLKKAAVHYTRRKNVFKIKGAAPGKVRLSEFKTIMVEPARQVGEGS
ncbi:MAG TPA: NFACT RNA binding domain-containing protein [Acidobacteriota bacterium]|jgi:predicted ribosome quality control (RQC) complex YloA/Tae2 family protein